MAKVIIFGMKENAELAHFYLTHDSEHEVVAFTVNKEYYEEKTFKGLPVVPFEDVDDQYPTKDFKFFAPLHGSNINKNREKVYNEIKEKGYEMITYISSKATVFPGLEIGDNCFIFEDNTIQPFTKIGNDVIMWSGNHIGHHGTIKDHIFFTSHVVLSGQCTVENYCYFGVNSTIRGLTHLAEGTFVAMGANLLTDTEPYGVYMGNPAKKWTKKSYEVKSL